MLKLKPLSPLDIRRSTPFAIFAALVAILVVVFVRAAEPLAAFEAESGTLVGAAQSVALSGASGAQVVRFGTGGSGTRTCPAYPAFPDASCTGVPSNVTLSNYSGSTSCGAINCLTTAGLVLDSKLITGGISICANNITITRSKIMNGRADMSCGGSSTTYTGASFTDVEFAGGNTDDAAIRDSGFTCTRCNIHDYSRGIQTGGMTLQDSWIHDLYGFGNPATTGSHNEAVLGTSNTILRHNRFDARWNSTTTGGGMSAAVAFYSYGNYWGPISNVVVDQNQLTASEGYCLYAGDDVGLGDLHRVSNMQFTNNVFVSNSTANPHTCGGYGAVAEYYSGHGNIWSNNTYVDGTPVNP